MAGCLVDTVLRQSVLQTRKLRAIYARVLSEHQLISV